MNAKVLVYNRGTTLPKNTGKILLSVKVLLYAMKKTTSTPHVQWLFIVSMDLVTKG